MNTIPTTGIKVDFDDHTINLTFPNEAATQRAWAILSVLCDPTPEGMRTSILAPHVAARESTDETLRIGRLTSLSYQLNPWSPAQYAKQMDWSGEALNEPYDVDVQKLLDASPDNRSQYIGTQKLVEDEDIKLCPGFYRATYSRSEHSLTVQMFAKSGMLSQYHAMNFLLSLTEHGAPSIDKRRTERLDKTKDCVGVIYDGSSIHMFEPSVLSDVYNRKGGLFFRAAVTEYDRLHLMVSGRTVNEYRLPVAVHPQVAMAAVVGDWVHVWLQNGYLIVPAERKQLDYKLKCLPLGRGYLEVNWFIQKHLVGQKPDTGWVHMTTADPTVNIVNIGKERRIQPDKNQSFYLMHEDVCDSFGQTLHQLINPT